MTRFSQCLECFVLLLAAWFLIHPAHSRAASERIHESYYSPIKGEQFFLLADSSFSSDEIAKVRLEAPGRDYRRYAMQDYGGVDIRVYRLEKPLEFLKTQKNLHRILKEGNFKGEGLSNTLAFLWDNWTAKSRRVMQRVFSQEARKQVTAEVPRLKMGNAIHEPTHFQPMPRFDPLPGLPMVKQFRYPIWEAKPIEPPKDVKLSGSSSEFIEPKPGNVYIPLGKLKPGLYLVEALIGDYRATTVVFGSNTTAVTKIAGNELLVWTTHKSLENPVVGATVLWSDGLGILKQGQSDAKGLLRLDHPSPERSFVIGEDSEGGVFVSENFYYDSEIYDTKLYAFTDRPLYRPGDWVEVKILGREFKNARESVAPQAAPIALSVIDANGTELQTLALNFDSASGAQSRFQLPDNATAGGYELRFSYRDQLYGSAFRVADYIKPHFEINLSLAKTEFKTGEAVKGTLAMVYPDGKAVSDARVQISLRAQQLSMVDNELQYLGQFPVELKTADLVADKDGHVALELPAAQKPSRYILTVFASDGAAYRVKTTKEILIERGATQYRVHSARNFSAANEMVNFEVKSEGQAANVPTRWEWIRLEDQSKQSGLIAQGQASFSIQFAKAGTYTVNVRDNNELLLGATAHSVSGEGVKAVPGTIEIVLDKQVYRSGDTAEALITFPEAVKEALLTLERDKVEATSLLSNPEAWLQIERLNETQYRARIAVAEHFSPNITFSVLYSKGNDYSFQNAGIRVPVAKLDLTVKTDKEVYGPGEKVNVDLQSSFGGQATPARLVVSVIDEMIYALQPEIAPDIGEFFYHVRRNNVRTSASLSFISYDIALPGSAQAPGRANRSERGVKVLERPRREEVDTAFWQPDLQTGPDGKARLSFTMPDSLTRWRITVRAMNAEGVVGQHNAFVRSEKALYLKWSGPTLFRDGDRPALGLLAFNQGKDLVKARFAAKLGAQSQQSEVELQRGINFIALAGIQAAQGGLEASLSLNDQVADALHVDLRARGANWQAIQTQSLLLTSTSTPITLPADARSLRLKLDSSSKALFRLALDDLLEYPYGCIEQTASRLLPLSLAYPILESDAQPKIRDRLRLIMQNSRLRLVQMAGPDAMFSWWGEAGQDAFLTAYAYYADWYASKALKVSLPSEHWQRVIEIYSQQVKETPLLQRALILSFVREMEMPIDTLLQGLAQELLAAGPGEPLEFASNDQASLVFMAPDSSNGIAAARVLTDHLAKQANIALPAEFAATVEAAKRTLAAKSSPFTQALLYLSEASQPTRVVELFQRLSPAQSTLERALILNWFGRGIGDPVEVLAVTPGAGWQASTGIAGGNDWHWQGPSLPERIDLAAQPGRAVLASVDYESADKSAQGLPVTITRKLWKLESAQKALSYRVQPVEGSTITSDALYLDEITINTTSEKPLRYGLLEVPLPPGADVERTTWGLTLSGLGGNEAQSLEKARHEPGELSYTIPLDSLSGETRLRHLVRFSQKGQFSLPPARYVPMYAPNRQAYESPVPLASIAVD